MKTIVHMMSDNVKFCIPFIRFIDKYFKDQKHLFLIVTKSKDCYENIYSDHISILKLNSRFQILNLLCYLNSADKIILHGLTFRRFRVVLLLSPWLFKKVYWINWGAEYYFPSKQKLSTKIIIKRIKNVLIYMEKDLEYIEKCYGMKATSYECIKYPNMVFTKRKIKKRDGDCLNIIVGNSATDTNCHIDIFERLAKYKGENICIYVPLSYGRSSYARQVINVGIELFGDKFKPITSFMEFGEYIELLSTIDIAFFNNNRSQGMGNIINLLGFGKKVYMRNDMSPYAFFDSIDVTVYDVADISLDMIDDSVRRKNVSNIAKYFSEENLVQQYKRVFNR